MAKMVLRFLAVSSVTSASALALQKLNGASFDEYVTEFQRGFARGSDEYSMRSELFEQRVREINEQNSKPDRLWTAGLNHLTDRTDAELQQIRGWRHSGNHPGTSLLSAHVDQVKSLPKEVDWRNTTSAKSVADQGACGSCWAVATAAMLQAHYEIHMGDDRTFSAQELVDCVPNPKECGGSGGCSGATVELAMKYVEESGLTTTAQTPYKGTDHTCKPASSLAQGDGKSGLAGLQSWRTLPSNKAEPLMDALQQGPVAISASASGWSAYFNGIFDSCSKDTVIDHAIVMVGYGTDAEKNNYWTVQNSWGKYWGENGFIRVKRGATTKEDDAFCGTDTRPGDGISCKPYPDSVKVCGMCGLLFDSVTPTFSPPSALQTVAKRSSFLLRNI